MISESKTFATASYRIRSSGTIVLRVVLWSAATALAMAGWSTIQIVY